MKLSTLILRLQEQQKLEGDIQVVIHATSHIREIERVGHSELTAKSVINRFGKSVCVLYSKMS